MKDRKKPKGLTLPTKPTTMAVGLQDHICLFYGPPGIGKSTFVNELGRVLFLSTDRGTRTLNAMRVECLTYTKFISVLEALQKPGAADNYDFVCVDHVDDMANMAEDYVCKTMGIESLSDGKWGKGWKGYRSAMQLIVNALKRLNLGVVFIAHEQIKTVKTRSVELDRTMPAMSKGAWQLIIPLCDLVGYCGFRRIKDKDGKRKEVRTIETNPTEALYAKDRSRRTRPEAGWEYLRGSKFAASFSNKAKE